MRDQQALLDRVFHGLADPAARVRAWTRLVKQVSHARGWPPLQVNVTTWATIGQDAEDG